MSVDSRAKRSKPEEGRSPRKPKEEVKLESMEPEAKKKSSFLVRLIIWIIATLVSPIVVLVMLLRIGEPVPRKWVASLSALLFVCIGLTWVASSVVDNLSVSALYVMGDYNEAHFLTRKLPFSDIINDVGLKYSIDPSLIAAIVSQESGFQSEEVSYRGNKGLMQISETVWRNYRPNSDCKGDHSAPKCSENCIFDAFSNLDVGAEYLRDLLISFETDVQQAVAAYNLGLIPKRIPISEDVNFSSGDYILGDITSSESNFGQQTAELNEYEVPLMFESLPSQNDKIGFTPSVIKKWIDSRSETIESRISFIMMAKTAREIASYVTFIIALIMMCWVLFKYSYDMAALSRGHFREKDSRE